MNDPDGLSPLERAWAVLSPPTGTQLTSFPLDFIDGSACRVALDNSGARHFLVPLRNEAVTADTRPAVLGLAVRRLTFAGSTETFVDVSCAEVELFPEFDEVVADVLDEVTRSDHPASTAAQAVSRWRRLFRSRLVRGLSHQAKLGLFAELSTLLALTDADRHFPVNAWRGPLREPHDFEALNHCLEVKAVGTTTDAVTIHGLGQLSRHEQKPLHLLLVKVIEDPDGRTIDDIVAQLKTAVDSRSLLQSRLAAAGWAASESSTQDAFTIQDVLQVRVDEETPRLVAESLCTGSPPFGVTNVRYDVDLAVLLPLSNAADLSRIALEVVDT